MERRPDSRPAASAEPVPPAASVESVASPASAASPVSVASVAGPIGAALLVGGIGYLASVLSLAWFMETAVGSPWWWPSVGLALIVLVRCPRSWWFALVPAFAVGHVLASRQFDPWPVTVTYLLANVVELVVVGWLLTSPRRVLGRAHRSVAEAATFAVAMVAAIGLGSVVIAVSGVLLPDFADSYPLLDGFVITHTLGLLAVAALLVPGSPRPRGGVWLEVEFAAVVLLAAALGWWAFATTGQSGRAFPVLLPVIWAAVRLDPWRATGVSLLISGLATYGTVRHSGTFATAATTHGQVLIVQVFIATVSITTLVLILVTRHRVQLAAQALDSERTMRIAIRDALVGMYSVRLDPGHVGEISEVNGALCTMLGYRPEQLLDQHCRILGAVRDPDDSALLDARLDRFVSGRLDSFRGETQFFTATGEPLWVEVSTSVVHTAATPVFALTHVHDLTDREQNKRLLEEMALHDALTGLPNRALLFQRLDAVLRQPDDERGLVGLLYLDLDGFKAVNDTFGHAAGDAVLIEVAQRLRGTVRPTDTVARLGGDEFAILCLSLRSDDDLRLMEARVHEALAAPMQATDDERVLIATSIGTALAEPGQDADDVVNRADAAMYVDKRAPRARSVVGEGPHQGPAAG